MTDAQATQPHAHAASRSDATTADALRLARIRERVAHDPAGAKAEAWALLRELVEPSEHHRLHGLFEQGIAGESPDGDCEGVVMNLYGEPWLIAMDRLVRLGQWLGGIGWTGKSFDREAGTGFNRLTSSARPAALLVMPTYRFERVRGELIGFHFLHALETSPIAPHKQVRAIKYNAPEHANPLVLPRTRDELVEIVPGVHLGRALLWDKRQQRWKVVGYFGLRHPVGG